MDGAPRANAAQLAARSIKAKPIKRKGHLGSPSPGLQFSSIPQQQSTQGGSGGLFGGSVQASGGFTFSAPQGPSFPPLSFGGNNTMIGNNNGSSSNLADDDDDDPRADTTGEEAARRKKPFRVPGSDSSSTSFKMPTTLTQNQQSNPFGQTNQQQNPSSGSFGFGQSQPQPSTPIFNFSTPTQNKPVNIFSFSGTSQPAQSPGLSFGSSPSQNKPATNLFSFSQPTQPAQSQAPIFNFGPPATQDKPASNPFQFTPSSTPRSSTGISFGSTPAPAPAATSGFQSTSTPAPAPVSTSGFQFAYTPAPIAQPSRPAVNFGAGLTANQPTSNLSQISQPQQAASSHVFAPQSQQSTPSSNIFASLKPQAPPPSDLSNKKDESSGIFGGKIQPTSTSANISSQPISTPSSSGQQNAQPSSSVNIFGNLNKSNTPSNNIFSKSNEKATPNSNPFSVLNQEKPASDLLGHLNKPVDQLLPQPKITDTPVRIGQDNAVTNATNPPPSVFSQTPISSLFGVPKQMVPDTPATQEVQVQSQRISENNSTRHTSPLKPIEAPASASQPPPSGMFQTLPQPNGLFKANDASSKSSITTALTSSASPTHDGSNGVSQGNRPPQISEDITPYTELATAAALSYESIAPNFPADFSDVQKQEFCIAFRMRSLNKAMELFFHELPIGADVNAAIAFYNEKRHQVLRPTPHISERTPKRKATDEEDQENENPNKRSRQAEVSNLHQTELQDQLSQNKESRPVQPVVNKNFAPKASTLAPRTSTAPNTPISADLSAKGKRKAEEQITRDSEEDGPQRLKVSKPNGVVGGSSTSNIFKNIVDSPPSSTDKKIRALPGPSIDEAPRFNPFSTLLVPASSGAKPAPTTSPSTSNIFSLKPTSASTSTNLAPAKPALATAGKGTTSPEPKDKPIKPPTFSTSSVNFMAQFSSQASKNEEDLMEKAKAEDMDSDEDEDEWEAKWKAKRSADLKALKDESTNKRATLVFKFNQQGKQSDSSKDSSKSNGTDAKATSMPVSNLTSNSTTSAPKSSFGQVSTITSSSSSIFSSSGTSTPRALSTTGSVLDSHTPGKPMVFGQNIFSHLSDAESGVENEKEDDAEDAEESEESGDESDSEAENKDPTYTPGHDNGLGIPVEETGTSIASIKKVAQSAPKLGGNGNSGTTPPGRSLFDRITKDSNGNPVRILTEEKENTNPGSTDISGNGNNLFSSINKMPAPVDKTWKPDSPIKFSDAIPKKNDSTSTPIVNITSATPTSTTASPFAGLFGKPISNTPPLFGIASTSKPPPTLGTSVGFAFGGQSSTTSSLFPSAAASTTTSRATSPGGTTDGDSATESNDPDVEYHEQISLTGGGPGEENEEIIHEVRAKVLKFNPKAEGDGSSPWETKGVGPLRVLKHKETKTSRILLRADPSGSIILNKALLPQVNYESAGKTLKLLTAGEGGKSLETWILQVKTQELAKALAEILQSNKP